MNSGWTWIIILYELGVATGRHRTDPKNPGIRKIRQLLIEDPRTIVRCIKAKGFVEAIVVMKTSPVGNGLFIIAQMPFTDSRGGIAPGLQQFAQGYLRGR